MTQLSRNALCPCGSGSKYKKCCLAKEAQHRKPRSDEDALIICMPTRGTVSHETLVGIEHNLGEIKYTLLRCARRQVVDARNLLAAEALKASREDLFPFTPRETFVLWLDDDAYLPPGVLPQMVGAMHNPAMRNVGAMFAWASARIPYGVPLVRRRLHDPQSYPRIGTDCGPGEVVDVEFGAFHTVLMRCSLLEKIGPEPFNTEPGESDDLAFCRRAKSIGARLVVPVGITVPHIDPRDGSAYVPSMPAFMMTDNTMQFVTREHVVGANKKRMESRSYGLGEENAKDTQERLLGNELVKRRALWG